MRATRIRNFSLLGEQVFAARDPLNDPLYGDVIEGADGERRFVEIRRHSRTRHVLYRSAGETPALSPPPLKCTLSDWRHWAKGGKVLCTTPIRTPFDSISRHPVLLSGSGAGASP